MSSIDSDEFNLSALDDYSPLGSPFRTSTPVPAAAGVGLSLNTPSPRSELPTPPLPNVSQVGVGTAGASQSASQLIPSAKGSNLTLNIPVDIHNDSGFVT